MRVFCNAYGLEDRRGLLGVIQRRQAVLYESLRAWVEMGDPAFVAMWREGHGEGILRDLAYVRRHGTELERGLLG